MRPLLLAKPFAAAIVQVVALQPVTIVAGPVDVQV